MKFFYKLLVDGAQADSMTNPFESQYTTGKNKHVICLLITKIGSVRIVKNCDFGLENTASSIFKTSVTVFDYADLPATVITR